MMTEKLAGSTFVQRRFRNEEEFERSLGALKARGIDTSGFEADGLFQAELFVSRPEADARAMPLEDIVTVTSGRFGNLGRLEEHTAETQSPMRNSYAVLYLHT